MTVINSGCYCVFCGDYISPFTIQHNCRIPIPPWPGQPIRGLDENEVRRIVREEIQKALHEKDIQDLRNKVQDPWKPPA